MYLTANMDILSSTDFIPIHRLSEDLPYLFSLFLLWRGHNEPGGGFIGGLVAAAGLIVYGLAEGPALMRQLLRVDPRTLVLVGLLTTIVSGILPLLQNSAFLKGAILNQLGDYL